MIRCVYLAARNYKARDFTIGRDPTAEVDSGSPLAGLVAIIGPTGRGKSSITEALELLITGRFDQVAGRDKPLTRPMDLLDMLGRGTAPIGLRGVFSDPLTTIDRRFAWNDDCTESTQELSTSLISDGKTISAKQKKIDERFGAHPAHFAIRELLRGSDRDRREAFLSYMASVPVDYTIEQAKAAVTGLPDTIASDAASPLQWLQEIRESADALLRTKTKRAKELQAERKSVATAITDVGDLRSVQEVEAEIAEIRGMRDDVIAKIGEVRSLRENRDSIDRQLQGARSKLESDMLAASHVDRLRQEHAEASAKYETATQEAESATAEHASHVEMRDSAQRSLEDAERELKSANKDLKDAQARLQRAESGVCPWIGEHCESIGSEAAVAERRSEVESRESDVERLKTQIAKLTAERDELAQEVAKLLSIRDRAVGVAASLKITISGAAQQIADSESAAGRLENDRNDVVRLERQLAEASTVGATDALEATKAQLDARIVEADAKKKEAEKALQNRERLSEIDLETARLDEETESLGSVVTAADAERVKIVSALVTPLSKVMEPLLAGAGSFEVQLVDPKGNVVFRPGLRGSDGLFRGLDKLSDGEVRIVWPAFCRGLSSFQERAGYRPVIVNSLETVSEDLRDAMLGRLVQEIRETTLGQAWVSWNIKRKELPKILLDAEAEGIATIIDLNPQK